MLIKRENFSDAASRSADPVLSTSLGETLKSSFDLTMKTERSISVVSNIRDKYDEVINRVKEETGHDLPNPYVLPGHLREDAEKRFQDQARELGVSIPNQEELRQEIGTDRQALREADAQLQKGESGLIQGAARFVGAAGAILTDPPIAASMLLGAPVASGVLRTALIEAGIGAAVEIPVQGIVQSSRREVGEDPSFADAVANVALAGAGGFVGGALVKGAINGSRSLVEHYRASGSPSAAGDKAAKYLDRLHDIEDANPVPERAGEFVQKFDEAYLNLTEPGRRQARVETTEPRQILDGQGNPIRGERQVSLLDAQGRSLDEVKSNVELVAPSGHKAPSSARKSAQLILPDSKPITRPDVLVLDHTGKPVDRTAIRASREVEEVARLKDGIDRNITSLKAEAAALVTLQKQLRVAQPTAAATAVAREEAESVGARISEIEQQIGQLGKNQEALTIVPNPVKSNQGPIPPALLGKQAEKPILGPSGRPAGETPDIVTPGRSEARIENIQRQPITRIVSQGDEVKYRLAEDVLEKKDPKLHAQVKKADAKVDKAEAELRALEALAEKRKSINPDAFKKEIDTATKKLTRAKAERAKHDSKLTSLARAERNKQRIEQNNSVSEVFGTDDILGKSFKKNIDDLTKAVERKEDQVLEKGIDVEDGKVTRSPEGAASDNLTTPPDTEKLDVDEAGILELLADSQDNPVKFLIEDEGGTVRELSARQIVKDLEDDENFLAQVKDCVTRNVAE